MRKKNNHLAWRPFPKTGHFDFDRKSLGRQWNRLHAADREPMPTLPALLDAWAHFHNGEFEQAFLAACALGPAGETLANRAACTYARHLEPDSVQRQKLFGDAAERAQSQARRQPADANAHHLLALALTGCSQDMSVAKGLAQGLGGRIKGALETAIRLQPQHAEAHIVLAAFHADVIDKVGALIAAMTYGAKRDTSMQLFQQGLVLMPASPMALYEYAAALRMLDGESARHEALAMHRKATSRQAIDAHDWLQIEAAKSSPLFSAL